jgi:hypothetical protein
MNWEMLAAIGQPTAVFVGILQGSLQDNAETATIFLRGMESFADLDAVSKLRMAVSRVNGGRGGRV